MEDEITGVSVIDKACEILKKTNDGKGLSPTHLWIVQEAVNGGLNDLGMKEFEALYQSVLVGYKKPWLFGIEHLTCDLDGYIYWKGQHVEHYDRPESPEMKSEAEELAERCRWLESRGLEVNVTNAIWKWDSLQERAPENAQGQYA